MSDQSGATSDHDAPTAAATAPVTVEQAAAILGVSVTTVRRRIRSGALRAEEARRPQGPVWLVYLPPDAAAATGSDREVSTAAATAPTTTPAADAMVSLIQTTIATVLGPLVGQLDAQRQTIERQADRVAELEREVGRLTERLALTAPESTLEASTAPQSPEPATGPPPARWRAWVDGALMVLTIVALIVLLVWPR